MAKISTKVAGERKAPTGRRDNPKGKLTDPKVKAARRGKTLRTLADGYGLVLLVKPNGSKLWRFRYRFDRVAKMLSLGRYPEVSLKEARTRLWNARDQLADGVDPSAARKAGKAAGAGADTFKAIAEEWLDLQEGSRTSGTVATARGRLERHVFPHIGSKQIGSVTRLELLGVLRRVESLGKRETARRVRQLSASVFRFAVVTERASANPAADLEEALAPVVTRNRAAITDARRVGELLRAIYGYQGQPTTKAALQLLPMLFVRPGELRQARWAEFDLDAGQWLVPAGRMKMRREHMVPLPKQAVGILRELHALTGRGELAFPGLRPQRPISENTVNTALRAMGFAADEVTAHGFRATASTLLHELGFPPEVIELQLAHAQRSQVAAAYNRSARLADRRKMMQSWADYLDGLRTGAKVTPIRRKGGAA